MAAEEATLRGYVIGEEGKPIGQLRSVASFFVSRSTPRQTRSLSPARRVEGAWRAPTPRSRLAMRHPTATLEIAGSGDHRPALEQLIASLDLGARVRFLGRISEEEKVALLRRAWALAFASPKEGWGITNLEAAACGTPVVASNSPGIRESVRDGETGFLVPHGDVAAMAAAMGRLADSATLVSTLGANGRRFAESFTWERAADETAAHLSRFVGCSTAP